MSKTIDLTGKIFGRLTVIRHEKHDKYRDSYWICECSCHPGKELNYSIRGVYLRKALTRSCGCVSRKYNDPKKISYLGLRNKYKSGALKRNLAFELSGEEFEKLVSSECYFCKTLPSKIFSPYSKINNDMKPTAIRNNMSYEYVLNTIIKYNGIDRIDNNIGYVASNCVPCCIDCNYLKSNFTFEDFKNRATDIIKNWEKFLNEKK